MPRNKSKESDHPQSPRTSFRYANPLQGGTSCGRAKPVPRMVPHGLLGGLARRGVRTELRQQLVDDPRVEVDAQAEVGPLGRGVEDAAADRQAGRHQQAVQRVVDVGLAGERGLLAALGDDAQRRVVDRRQRPGRRAIGGVTVQGLFVFQRRQPIDAGAANHRQGDVHRIQALSA